MTCQTIKSMNPTQGVIIIFRQRKKAKIITIIAIFLLIIASILYGLANRYLFEHVEVVVAPNNITTQAEPVKQSTAQAQTDDWNYKDDNETVSIQKVQIGSGSDTITYFVADVTFNTTTNLLTAFAKNAFGTNIIENTSTIAANNNAVFAINGDYYGFRNDGVIIRSGTVYRDEPARDGLALLSNGTLKSYNEEETSSEALLAEGTTNTFSFGPTLVETAR